MYISKTIDTLETIIINIEINHYANDNAFAVEIVNGIIAYVIFKHFDLKTFRPLAINHT